MSVSGAPGLLQCLHLPAEGGDGQALGLVILELPEWQQCPFLVPVFVSRIFIVLKILKVGRVRPQTTILSQTQPTIPCPRLHGQSDALLCVLGRE